jgi:hypothetical protein
MWLSASHSNRITPALLATPHAAQSTNWCISVPASQQKLSVRIVQTAMEDPMPRTASKTLPLDIQRM